MRGLFETWNDFKETHKRIRIARAISNGTIPRGRTDFIPKSKTMNPRSQNTVTLRAALSAKVLRAGIGKKWEDLGVISVQKVTTAFVNYLVDGLQNSSTPMDVFRYHDSGTGTNPEDKANTVLQIPCGESRDVGSQTEGSSGNIYKTVATHTYSGSFAITEHGVFSAAAVGVLLDRSVFGAINVGIGDKIEFTYELTCQAEN